MSKFDQALRERYLGFGTPKQQREYAKWCADQNKIECIACEKRFDEDDMENEDLCKKCFQDACEKQEAEFN